MDTPQILCANCGTINIAENTLCRHCKQPLQNESSSLVTTSSFQSSSPDKLLNNRYRLLEIVGRGGMGTVYKAEDVRLGRRLVAVKEMRPQGSQSQEERNKASQAFEQEALLLARLSHPCLPSIYDHFSSNGRWYLVMEYITGVTLSQRLHSMPDEHLPLSEALDIGIKLCIVLDYLHTQTPPIVFGDLKPDNIMLTSGNDLYLIDFGIARLFQTIPADERAFVSEGYSAPEQYQSANISPLADVYSLGATLYQMLSGNHPPKVGESFKSLGLAISPLVIQLEVIIMSLVEYDEEKRPQDINAVKQALQRIVRQQTQAPSIPQGSSSWDGGTSMWGTSPSFGSSPTIPFPELPASISYLDVQLSLDEIATLEWSPNGTLLAATNLAGEVHIYKWPSKEDLFLLENKTLAPLVAWLSESEESTTKQLHSAITWSPDSTHLALARGTKLFIQELSSATSSLLYTQENTITEIEWSPDGKYLATLDRDDLDNPVRVQVRDVDTGKKLREYTSNGLLNSRVVDITWSPDSTYLAFAIANITVRLPRGQQDFFLQQIAARGADWLESYGSEVQQQSKWGKQVSDADIEVPLPSDEGFIVYEAITGHKAQSLISNSSAYSIVIYSSDGTRLVTSSSSEVDIWDIRAERKLRSLQGPTGLMKQVASLAHDRLLAAVSENLKLYIWRTDTWVQVAVYDVSPPFTFIPYSMKLSFQPTANRLAAHFHGNTVHIWDIDATQLLTEPPSSVSIQYTNAKVVLVGDSGVGKSGLGLVLSQRHFEPTESTHGRRVWTFERKEDPLKDGRREIQETLLWDMAGQPGYRLIHQLHLNEVAVALVVFDAHSETDPFAGIAHWIRALQTAQRVRGSTGTLKKFLVMARIDRGGRQVSRERIDELAQKWGFDGYFETSAKEGISIAELADTIRSSIDWEQLPKVTSTELFQGIKDFLLAEKQAGRLLSTIDSLYSEFLKLRRTIEEENDFLAEFTTCIRLLESAGLIRQLSFGSLVLLQPELLDTYTSALVNAVKDEPDGLGSILEETVKDGAFFIPTDQRTLNRDQEKLLLIAMIEDLLSYEIALREQSDAGPYLVFPSESIRENPDLPDPENVSVAFIFEGPIRNIYATLVVRLSHSGLFVKKDLWKNAITYQARVGGKCGLWLKVIDEGKGELTLFFDALASGETRFNFEDYIQVHLERKALSESIKRQCIFRCEKCGFIATDQLVRKRTELGFKWFNCPVCETRVSLRDHKDRLGNTSQVPEMDRAADVQRAHAKAQTTVQGKQETDDFDVFLCYNEKDQKAVIDVGERLKEQGLLPWLNIWEQRPGFSWQKVLEKHIRNIKAAAVFVGKNGVAPWQQVQIQSLLREFVERECPVIPVLLAEVSEDNEPELPLFLKNNVWVDFRKRDPDPMDQLVWGITGKRYRG